MWAFTRMSLLTFIIYSFFLLVRIDATVTDSEKENYFSIGAHLNAESFSKALKKVANEKLLASRFQNYARQLPFTSIEYSEESMLSVVKSIDKTIAGYIGMLDQLISTNSTTTPKSTSCTNIHDVIKSDSRTPCYIQHTSLIKPPSKLSFGFHPIYNDRAITGQYLFASQMQFEYPAVYFISAQSRRHWHPYLDIALRRRKDVVILIDTGYISTEAQLANLKIIAKHLIETASVRDRYTIMVAGDGEIQKICPTSAPTNGVAFSVTITRMLRFIDTIQLPVDRSHTTVSAHALALTTAIGFLGSKDSKESVKIVNYISRGLLTELSDASKIMNKVVAALLMSGDTVKINTIVVAEENRTPLPWSMEFMENIATQDFDRYRQTLDNETSMMLDTSDYVPVKGETVVVSGHVRSMLDLRKLTEMLDIPSVTEEKTQEEEEETKIHWDIQINNENGGFNVLTIYKSFSVDSYPALVGIDLHLDFLLSELFSDAVVQLSPALYDMQVVMTDVKGIVLLSTSGQSGMSLAAMHSWPSASRWVLDDISKEGMERGTFDVRMLDNSTRNYYWVKLTSLPFVLITSVSSTSLPISVSTLQIQQSQQFGTDHMVWGVWQRGDQLHPPCLLFGNPIVPGYGAVYLSPSAYAQRGKEQRSAPNNLRNNWVYLVDRIGLIRSNTLREGVREEAGVLSSLVNEWIEEDMRIKGVSPIIRRYAATSRGVMVVYPATALDDNYEPVQQEWFIEAQSHPFELIVTGPEMDGVIGDVVTLSIAITLPINKEDNGQRQEQVFAVLAMDIPSNYLGVLLEESISNCGQSRRCILFSPSGYSLYSGDDGDKVRSASDAVEKYHISHVEPLLATQLLQNNQLVKKSQCIEEEGTRRSFLWDTKYTRVYTIGCGDSTVSPRVGGALYAEVLLVPGTTVFLAMVNTSCNRTGGRAFCPCSVHDRRCLFCARFDDQECECPCQCTATATQHCASGVSTEINMCPIRARKDSMVMDPLVPSNNEYLKQCLNTDCSTLLHPSACRSTAGCEWCRLDKKGNRIGLGVCSATAQCYQGIQGRTIWKFRDSDLELTSSGGAPIGPLAAVIMIAFVVLVIVVYCYRAQVSRMVERRSISDSFGAPLFERGGTAFEFDHDGTVFREEKLPVQLASFERAAPAPTNRRPAPPTVSSDHGYSTMTDRNTAEESDYNGSVIHEPLRVTNVAPSSVSDCTSSSVITTEAEVHQIPPGIALLA